MKNEDTIEIIDFIGKPARDILKEYVDGFSKPMTGFPYKTYNGIACNGKDVDNDERKE